MNRSDTTFPAGRPAGRYSRQALYAPIGPAGQRRLAAARVTLIGCGALGVHLADTLARAGIGTLRLVDPDRVELSNLQRQTLFDTHDAATGRPKVIAAAEKLNAINPGCAIEPVQNRATAESIESLIAGSDLVLDAVDSFAARCLINQACLKQAIPWIHGGCLAAAGNGLVVLPGGRPCFACLIPKPPARMITCNEVGIIAPAVATIAAWQAAQALKLLIGDLASLDRSWFCFDLWANTSRHLILNPGQFGCPVCVDRQFDLLT